MKIKRNRWGGGGGRGQVGEGQGGCERRIEVFVNVQKRIFFGGVMLGRVGGGGGGGQGGCGQRIEVFVKIKKKFGGGGKGIVKY